jgi:hypothetical protein
VNVGSLIGAFNTSTAVTKAVVAIWVVLVPADAVGAVGTPVNDGELMGAPPPPDTAATAVVTNAVVATCVVLVPPVAVGAVGVPVNAGDASGALAANAAVSPFVSVMSSESVGTDTVPVNVGFAAVNAVVNTGLAVGAAPSNPRIVEKLFGVAIRVFASVEIPVTAASVDAPPDTVANCA